MGFMEMIIKLFRFLNSTLLRQEFWLIKRLFKNILIDLIFRNSCKQLITTVKSEKSIPFLYLIPAGLYCLYNNLAFFSLKYVTPTTYFMFMQIRLLLTGLIYQVHHSKIIIISNSKLSQVDR